MSIEIHDVRIPVTGASGQGWELAATVFLPPALALASGPDLFFLLPGAGYSRGYFNLPVPGFSEAMYHAGRGNIVVTLDYLGAGDSSTPADATLEDATATTDAAVRYVADKLAEGSLIKDLGPTRWGWIIGAGQSLGGHLVVATQAAHETFKGIATLGTSIAGTAFPTRDGGKEADLSKVDFAYGFHWLDPIPAASSGAPTDLASLVAADAAAGLGMRTGTAPWASTAIPSYTMALLADGLPQANAAKIDKPVLLVAGERDVTLSPEEEAAPFSSSPDVVGFTLPQAAHMHNFSETREELWKRLDTFVMHASTFTRKIQSTVLMELMQKAQEEAEKKSAEMAAEETK